MSSGCPNTAEGEEDDNDPVIIKVTRGESFDVDPCPKCKTWWAVNGHCPACDAPLP